MQLQGLAVLVVDESGAGEAVVREVTERRAARRKVTCGMLPIEKDEGIELLCQPSKTFTESYTAWL